MVIKCSGENLTLSKERAIYWETKKILIISDLHIGKSAYFRKSGIQVPDLVSTTDLHRLTSLVHEFNPETLLITGDMFHNNINSDANAFLQWRKSFAALNVVLVKGNHDRLKDEDYEALDINIYHKEWLCAPFRFIHDKPKTIDEYYTISGHIHPGVVIYGKAKQQLKFPCFYFGKNCAVLPAFSVFTGLKILRSEADTDRFYAITTEQIIAVPSL